MPADLLPASSIRKNALRGHASSENGQVQFRHSIQVAAQDLLSSPVSSKNHGFDRSLCQVSGETMTEKSWDYWYGKKERIVEPEVLKLEQILRTENLRRVLDFGCGTGRHTIHLARSGFNVEGLTRPPQLLNGEGSFS